MTEEVERLLERFQFHPFTSKSDPNPIQPGGVGEIQPSPFPDLGNDRVRTDRKGVVVLDGAGTERVRLGDLSGGAGTSFGAQIRAGELGNGASSQTTVDDSGLRVQHNGVERVRIGALGGGNFGLKAVSSGGQAIIDGEKVQLSQAAGRAPSGVEFGVSQTQVTPNGVEVVHNGISRVTLGAIGGGDFGLKVTNGGSVVIIDGSSNMFKIVASGTLVHTQAANSGGASSVTFPGAGLPAWNSPAFISYITQGTSPDTNSNRNLGSLTWPRLANHTAYAADTFTGVTNTDFYPLSWEVHAYSHCDLSGVPALSLHTSNGSPSEVSAFVRYHILKEAAI